MDQDSEQDEIYSELFCFFLNDKRYTCRFEQNKTKLKTLLLTVFSIKPPKFLACVMSHVE